MAERSGTLAFFLQAVRAGILCPQHTVHSRCTSLLCTLRAAIVSASVSLQGAVRKRSSNKLRDTLMSSGLVTSLGVLIAQLRAKCL
jgi:hypothetical protein